MNNELPILVKRCLASGVIVAHYQQTVILQKYRVHQIPDEDLNVLGKEDLSKYVKALYLAGQEMYNDWSQGHLLLMELGFVREERKEGFRTFVSLVYKNKEKENG